MIPILVYSGLLLGGIVFSQVLDLSGVRGLVHIGTMVCLAYIMIEVGLEFVIDKKKLRSYGLDYGVSASAAAFPWLLCSAYFLWQFKTDWKEALLVGCFAAPTSAGVLFAMLAAAGLGATWVFKKAQVLAIFDDLFTVLLLIPLKILFVGPEASLFAVILFMLALLWAAYRWLHRLRWKTGKVHLFGYGILLTAFCVVVERITHVHLEVLLPAFAFGCILFNSHDSAHENDGPNGHGPEGSEQWASIWLDRVIKGTFMLLVGLSLPRIEFAEMGLSKMIGHVVWLSILANLGKCVPIFFYSREATIRERLALAVAMFPRGEVGGGVLLIAMGFGLSGPASALAGLSLAVNLVLIGLFILIVKKLVGVRTVVERA